MPTKCWEQVLVTAPTTRTCSIGAGQDQIGNAVNYANANAQPLIDAALRDSTRNLEENTLRDIGMSASGSNNTNSSRAGVAAAIAGRDYMDRATDTGAGIREDRLAKDYLTQSQNQFANQMAANQGLGNVFNTGFGMGGDAANMMTACWLCISERPSEPVQRCS